MTVFLIINVVITVYNWDDEVDFIKITAKESDGSLIKVPMPKGWQFFNPLAHISRMYQIAMIYISYKRRLAIAITLFALDFIVTGASATLFGIGVGVVGSAVTLFMSNLLSSVFLIPKDSDMERVKRYQRSLNKKRWIWFPV